MAIGGGGSRKGEGGGGYGKGGAAEKPNTIILLRLRQNNKTTKQQQLLNFDVLWLRLVIASWESLSAPELKLRSRCTWCPTAVFLRTWLTRISLIALETSTTPAAPDLFSSHVWLCLCCTSIAKPIAHHVATRLHVWLKIVNGHSKTDIPLSSESTMSSRVTYAWILLTRTNNSTSIALSPASTTASNVAGWYYWRIYSKRYKHCSFVR